MYCSTLLQMIILMAASRGGDMKSRLKRLIDIDHVEPGATLKTLTNHVVGTKDKPSIIPPVNQVKSAIFVYVMGGVCDVTERLESEDENYRYREIVFLEEPEACADKVCRDIDNLAREIKEKDAIPVFATVTKANIGKYNQSELEAGKTSILYHSDFYDDMQKNSEIAIDIINGYIKRLNKANNVSTPLCHNVLIRRRGRKGKYRINNWKTLRDGVHGTYKTRNNWAKALKHAMDLNNASDEIAMTASPKRSWKNY